MGLDLDSRVARWGDRTPRGAVIGALRAALGDLRVALCLHRVGPALDGSFLPAATIEAGKLDTLVELMLASRRGRDPWLTLTFDDGYADAVEYVASRAARYPDVEFVVFACPEKAEKRAGFRWDLVDRDARQGGDLEESWRRHMGRPLDILAENDREELRAVAALPEYRLATLAELAALRSLPNVALGNHTNCHFKASDLAPDELAREVERSEADFARLLGAPAHFAFPYGWPFLDAERVALVAARTAAPIWSTTRRPYPARERHGRGALPRFVVDGRPGARGSAASIAARAAAYRARGPRHGVEEP
ncbi:MAG TPA: polysaccharide deacetylase family protein [Anaeromyxobacteraceae bacterium]|nr:polysaccharide deacetylase family protein [Anaeromyxobacteraceae bacterium]